MLLAWYDREARTLPWRSQPTPYRVWVSEIMLQQTRVEAVLHYFEHFVAALPDLPALARADEAMLMKLWQGLGYYSRARNMQKAARLALERHGGELPGDVEVLLALPGIGEYTAGAIASIAFGRPVEAVDGNVLRVQARLMNNGADISQPAVKRDFRAIVRGMLPGDRPGDFNQALMDLGATVCLPNGEPLCARCPLSGLCAGHRAGTAASLPVKAAKKPRDVRMRTVFVLMAAGRVLLAKRPLKGLLAGLWELPSLESWLDEGEAAAALLRWGVPAGSAVRLPDAKHVFTHVEWHMRGYLLVTRGFTPPFEHAWADELSLKNDYAVPSAFKAYMKYVGSESPLSPVRGDIPPS